jgi:hypothetical protein
VDHSHFSTTVSYSKNKQVQGEIILGSEESEVQENTGLSRIDVQVMGETEDETKDHNEILMSDYYF